MNAPTHVVTRPFTEVEPLKPGQPVNARDWPNAQLLVEQGYLRPATPADIEAVTADDKGRGRR